MAETKIPWADVVWNPTTGCSKGCSYCYAARMAKRFWTEPVLASDERYSGSFLETRQRPFSEVRCHPERLDIPSHWRKPRRIFVDSMGDLFDPAIPDEFLDYVFAIMATARQHTYMILTKRSQRMAAYVGNPERLELIYAHWSGALGTPAEVADWPLPNVWLGVSVPDQTADRDVWPLLRTPAAIRFISVEPMLGPVDLNKRQLICRAWSEGRGTIGTYLDWVICGGQSGPGARPLHPDWARGLRDQCQVAGVAFWFKQWGEWAPYPADPDGRGPYPHCALHTWTPNDPTPRPPDMWRVGKKAAGDMLDGRQWHDLPGSKQP